MLGGGEQVAQEDRRWLTGVVAEDLDGTPVQLAAAPVGDAGEDAASPKGSSADSTMPCLGTTDGQ